MTFYRDYLMIGHKKSKKKTNVSYTINNKSTQITVTQTLFAEKHFYLK